MSLPFASALGGLFLPGLAPPPQPGLPALAPPPPTGSQLALPPPQPGLPGTPSTLPPELLQLVNSSQPREVGHVLDLLGPPGSSLSRGDSVPPPDAAGRVSTQTNQYASRHQAAEQRRRTRINERLDALRTLVPHAERANTACFLEEVIKYIIRLKDRNDQLEGAMDMLRACNKPGGASSAAPRAQEGSTSQAAPPQPKAHQPQPRQHRKPSNSGPQQQQQQQQPHQPQLQQQHPPDALPSTSQPTPVPHPLLPQQAPQHHHLVGLPHDLLSLQQHKHPQHGQVPQGQPQSLPPPPQHQQHHHQQLQSQLLLLQLQQQQQHQQLLQQQLQQASSQPLAGTVQGMQMSLPPFSNSLGLPISLDVPSQQHHLAPPHLNHAHLPTMSMDMQQHQHHQQLHAQQLQLLLPPGVMLAAPPPHLGISPAELQQIQQLQHLQHLQQQQQLLHPQLSPSQPIAVGNGSTGVVLPTAKPEQAGNGSNEAGSSQDGAGMGARDAGSARAGAARAMGGTSAVGEKVLPSQQQQQQGAEGQQVPPAGSSGVNMTAGGEDGGAGGAKGASGSGTAASGSLSSPASSEESRGVPPKKRKMLAL
ncbi:hypothetical protein DUNSADRAFT_7780 [Dunaliella salina]|uniref:BHLH domain-containing protein n=1 Tax=Dunaliella salina TaxID=3046 RepID=A0ABQ7GKP8_DUNSA|nr:hypothetical protein DUNSADRAFT_7780 [Dunaliella salina]|eukprot:KAF5835190.1 hypothetical protein DUNSADRAFT_7780 [Dunaliella salina]